MHFSFRTVSPNVHNELVLSPFSLTNVKPHHFTTRSLYPYYSIKLSAIFVYGQDFNRNIDLIHLSSRLLIFISVFNVVLILLALILWIGRRKLKVRPNEFTLALLDILIAVWAGGNLRIRHRLERWFFGILLITFFFFNSIFTGDLINQIFRVQSHKVTKFEELSPLNLTIYTNPGLKNCDVFVDGMLRYQKFNL